MAGGGLKCKDYVWMWVTQDALSLPLVTADSSRMLAIKCGVNHSTIRSSVSKYEAGIIQG